MQFLYQNKIMKIIISNNFSMRKVTPIICVFKCSLKKDSLQKLGLFKMLACLKVERS